MVMFLTENRIARIDLENNFNIIPVDHSSANPLMLKTTHVSAVKIQVSVDWRDVMIHWDSANCSTSLARSLMTK